MTPFDSAEFRRVLGHYPTGVTVVTGVENGSPVGLAIGSFGSVSLDPPLVMFCPGKSSSSWPAIQRSGSFCVNVLADDQAAISSRFAGRDPDKFAGVEWSTRVTGSPVIDGCLAAGVHPRIEIGTADEAKRYLDMGARHFCIGTDIAILHQWWQKEGEDMRKALDE